MDAPKIKTQEVTLSALAAYLAVNALEQNGWTKSNRELVAGNEVIALLDTHPVLSDVPEEINRPGMTQRLCRDAAPEWCNQSVTLTLTDRQRDALRKCLTALRDSMRLPAGSATTEIITAFALD